MSNPEKSKAPSEGSSGGGIGSAIVKKVFELPDELAKAASTVGVGGKAGVEIIGDVAKAMTGPVMGDSKSSGSGGGAH